MFSWHLCPILSIAWDPKVTLKLTISKVVAELITFLIIFVPFSRTAKTKTSGNTSAIQGVSRYRPGKVEANKVPEDLVEPAALQMSPMHRRVTIGTVAEQAV